MWLYGGAGGIEVDAAKPGYRHFMLRPQLTTRLDYVKATYESPYGRIASQWRRENGHYVYDVTVPANSSATVALPAGLRDTQVSGDPGLVPEVAGAQANYAAPPGTYHFSFSAESLAGVPGYK